MHKKQELKKQIQTVINILEKEYSQEIHQGVLELIYRRYRMPKESCKPMMISKRSLSLAELGLTWIVIMTI